MRRRYNTESSSAWQRNTTIIPLACREKSSCPSLSISRSLRRTRTKYSLLQYYIRHKLKQASLSRAALRCISMEIPIYDDLSLVGLRDAVKRATPFRLSPQLALNEIRDCLLGFAYVHRTNGEKAYASLDTPPWVSSRRSNMRHSISRPLFICKQATDYKLYGWSMIILD